MCSDASVSSVPVRLPGEGRHEEGFSRGQEPEMKPQHQGRAHPSPRPGPLRPQPDGELPWEAISDLVKRPLETTGQGRLSCSSPFPNTHCGHTHTGAALEVFCGCDYYLQSVGLKERRSPSAMRWASSNQLQAFRAETEVFRAGGRNPFSRRASAPARAPTRQPARRILGVLAHRLGSQFCKTGPLLAAGEPWLVQEPTGMLCFWMDPST